MKKRIYVFLICIPVILSGSGCFAYEETNYFAYSKTDFSARICGEHNGINFEAEIFKEQDKLTIKYVSPDSIKGITAIFDGKEEHVICGQNTAVIDANGLLYPIYLYLPDTEKKGISSAKKQEGAFVISVMDTTYVFPMKFNYPESICNNTTRIRTISFSTIE